VLGVGGWLWGGGVGLFFLGVCVGGGGGGGGGGGIGKIAKSVC